MSRRRIEYASQEDAELAYIKLSKRIFDPKINDSEFKLVAKELEEVRDYLTDEHDYDRYDFVNLCRESRK